ncbi:MAG: flagellar hook capping FlgD N-terminal domain-containing protein [Acetobacteraceae bacterium]|nr:flagellar hook capping FlgD N-terminal domain-containing protein [Acetobacteraceae bacterium]
MSGSTASSSQYTTPTLSSAASSAAATAAASASGGTNALSQLSSNYNDFLQMLMTQLQNQDPSSPMDANSFTQELVQFSGVEQQINTNTSLTQLIQLTQQDGLLQSSSLVGKQVAVANSNMPLQNGQGGIQFSLPAAGNVAISVSDANGNLLDKTTIAATQGTNTWTWNGATSSGTTAPDGNYTVTVNSIGAGGATAPVAFNAIGTVTGVTASSGSLAVQMGSVSDSIGNVQQVIN